MFGQNDRQIITYIYCGNAFTDTNSPNNNEVMVKRVRQQTLLFLIEVLYVVLSSFLKIHFKPHDHLAGFAVYFDFIVALFKVFSGTHFKQTCKKI